MKPRPGYVPQEWIREVRAGKSAKQIAAKFGIEKWRDVHVALMNCGAYRVG